MMMGMNVMEEGWIAFCLIARGEPDRVDQE